VEQAAAVALHDCVCRLQRDKLGERCRFPLHVCLALYDRPHPDDADLISTERALAVLDEAEEAGLVHTVSNVAGRWDWICNCCSCCCEFLRGYAEWNVENAVVRNYRATIDADACTGCGECEERCQVAAVTVEDDRASVDTDRCLGCGLCVTTCPADAVRLDRLSDAELIRPPADPERWAEDRLRNRGAREP
jgi:ferredoxin